MAYLMHFNKLHSKKNGQFISGDGDSDGKVDEHHRYTKGASNYITKATLSGNSKKEIATRVKEKYNKTYSYDLKPKAKQQTTIDGPVTKEMAGIGLKLGGGFGKWIAGKAFCSTQFGKGLTTTWKYTKKYANLDKIFKDVKISDLTGTDKLKTNIHDKMSEKTAGAANKLYKKYKEKY